MKITPKFCVPFSLFQNIVTRVLVCLYSLFLMLRVDVEINPGHLSNCKEYFSICHWNLSSISALTILNYLFWKHILYFINLILFQKLILILLLTVWNVSKYRVFPGLYFPVFGLNTERYLSLRIQSECWKIRTRKNSIFGHFLHSYSHQWWQITNSWIHFDSFWPSKTRWSLCILQKFFTVKSYSFRLQIGNIFVSS